MSKCVGWKVEWILKILYWIWSRLDRLSCRPWNLLVFVTGGIFRVYTLTCFDPYFRYVAAEVTLKRSNEEQNKSDLWRINEVVERLNGDTRPSLKCFALKPLQQLKWCWPDYCQLLCVAWCAMKRLSEIKSLLWTNKFPKHFTFIYVSHFYVNSSSDVSWQEDRHYLQSLCQHR